MLDCKSVTSSASITLLGLTALCTPSWAFDVNGIDMHGSLSATGGISDTYNFLGDTDGDVDLVSTELILNGQYLFKNGVRAGAQIYGYETAGYADLTLDYASLSYEFSEKFGVSVGRNKLTFGLYNDSQDIDFIRPFVELPMGVYNKSLRPLMASYDGVGFNGTFGMGDVGVLKYTLNVGKGISPSADSWLGESMGWGGYSNVEAWNSNLTYGGSLFWHTPVDGLRVGFSAIWFKDGEITGEMATAEDLYYRPSDVRFLPQAVGGNDVWNANIAGTPTLMDTDFLLWMASVEYVADRYTLAAEYRRTKSDITMTDAIVGVNSRNVSESDTFYFMGSYRLSDQWELGAYASFAFSNIDDRDGESKVSVPDHTAWSFDYAVSAAYHINDNWLIKAEAHYVDGTSNVENIDGMNGDPSTWDQTWLYYTLKTTFYF